MFDHTSRYDSIPNAIFRSADGREVAFKRRRFLPHGEQMPVLAVIRVEVGDRLDLVAARTLGDPLQYWQICDANNALDPRVLTSEPGTPLRIPVGPFHGSPYLDGQVDSSLPDGEG